MKWCVVIVALAGVWIATKAETWQPPAGLAQIPLWPGEPPDTRPVAGPEVALQVTDRPIAGRSWTLIGGVVFPTMTVFSPMDGNTGVAVLVFPGGGYNELAIDLEGTEVCEWLAARGITGVLLKYRVPGEEGYMDKGYRRSGPYPRSPLALQDAQRALGLVRSRADEWGIDPRKIGVLGFSAGGHLVAAMSTQFPKRVYAVLDAADEQSCRPDFAVAVYAGKLWNWDYRSDPTFELNPNVPVTRDTPPTLIIHAQDDPVDPVDHALVYYVSLKKAGVPAEMHLYSEGGHAFGLRRTERPVTHWPDLLSKWLATLGLVPRSRG